MRIFLVGITGAMGSTILSLTDDVVAGYGIENGKINSIPVYNNFSEVQEDFDVIVDFSNKNITEEVLDFVEKKNKPLVLATTGLSLETEDRIKKMSERIPLVYTKNYSIGINVMDEVIKELTRTLNGFDIEIIEKHHNQKQDAPSGTAKMLFDSIKTEKKNAREIYDRTKTHNKREEDEVGISVIRGGSIVGEHLVIFAGLDEVIEIKHQAGSKKIFAKGALKACEFIITKEKGLFDMKNVIKGE